MRHVVSVTSNTTLSSAHAGCDLLVTGGQIDITLPLASGMADCDIRVINGDTGNAKRLINFPADVNQRLWPRQSINVNTDGSTWFADEKPGRFKISAGQKVYVHPSGSDTNDGMTSATALQHIGYAGTLIQTDFDTNQQCPVIAPAINQTYYNDPLVLGGQPTGGNLIQLSPDGNGSFTWMCDGPCINVGDNAELNIALTAYGVNGTIRFNGNRLNVAGRSHIYMHNNGLFDMSGKPTFVGNGTNDCAIFFDGPTAGAALSDGFYVENTFGDLFRMDEGGGRFTLSGEITPVPLPGTSIYPIVGRLFAILGTSELILSTAPAGGPWTSLGQSVVGGNANLITNGASIPGTVVATQGGVIATTKF